MLIQNFFHQTEHSKLLENIQKAQHTLLIGDIGIGKTHLLRQVQSQRDKTIYIESVSPFKSASLEILQTLHENGDLQIKGMDVEYLNPEELLKKLKRLNIKELLDANQKNLSGKGYVLLLDHLETATPSMEKKIEAWMKSTPVVGAANKLKYSLKKLWWRFEQIEIPPLTKDDSKQLLWQLIDRNSIADAEFLESKILTQANGNPLAIKELADKAMREENLTADNIRQLKHQAGTRFIDITPVFFIIGALAVATRFVALGMNSTELYILAGVACSFFMGVRYFLYRSMKKDE